MSPKRPRDQDLGERDLIADATGALLYAFHFDGEDQIVFDWQTGGPPHASIPIRDLLAGTLESSDVPRVEQHLARLRAGTHSQLWLRRHVASGECQHLHDSARVETDGSDKPVRVVGAVRDVTDATTKSSGDLRVRERVIENLDQGVAHWDRDGRLMLANRTLGEMFSPPGSRAPPLGSIDAFLQALATSGELVTDDSPLSWIDRTSKDRQRQRRVEWQMADGRYLTATWRHLDGGELLCVEDTTSAKGGERALLRAKSLAEDASSKKSRFLRAANHDLRQPLATLKILVFSALAMPGGAEHHAALQSMDVSLTIMEEILESLLQVGQLDADRVAVRTHHFQASQMLDRLRTAFAPLAEAHALDFRIINSPLTLATDRVLLERILGNFISNAIRFTRRGGVLVGARRRGRHADIQVWDTGSGIPDDQLERIFEEFHRLEDQPSDRQRGLGLGLNIAHRLSGLLQHPIRVASVLGRGSMFSISVPIGDIWQSQVGDPEISERIGGEFLGVAVLLIEDDAHLREAMHEMLLRWGVDVVSVADGPAAVKALETTTFRPKLVIVDYCLPGAGLGTDVLARVRKHLGEDIPGIVCTADNDPSFIASIRRSGLPILIKPTSPPRLRSVMHHLLFERQRPDPSD